MPNREVEFLQHISLFFRELCHILDRRLIPGVTNIDSRKYIYWDNPELKIYAFPLMYCGGEGVLSSIQRACRSLEATGMAVTSICRIRDPEILLYDMGLPRGIRGTQKESPHAWLRMKVFDDTYLAPHFSGNHMKYLELLNRSIYRRIQEIALNPIVTMRIEVSNEPPTKKQP